MMYLLCVLLPPPAVFLMGRMGAFIVSLLLTLPGVIHAFFVVSDAKSDKRAQATVEAIRREQRR